MIIGRLLMRVLLVPLGGCVAVVVAMMFVMVAHWNRIEPAAVDEGNELVALLVAPMLALSVAYMMFPSVLAVLISEAFAIRSWMYHAAAGGLSAVISLATVGAFDKSYDMSDEPLIAVGAGIAAGFAYWAVAGWSAGFWKPVFSPRPANLPDT